MHPHPTHGQDAKHHPKHAGHNDVHEKLCTVLFILIFCLHAEIFILLINLSLEFIYLNPCLVRFFFLAFAAIISIKADII